MVVEELTVLLYIVEELYFLGIIYSLLYGDFFHVSYFNSSTMRVPPFSVVYPNSLLPTSMMYAVYLV